MNKTTNKTTTHKDSLVRADLPLEDHELDSVSGGSPSQGGQKDPAAQTYQKILQQLTQG